MDDKLFIMVVNAIVDAEIEGVHSSEIWGMHKLAAKLGLDNERLHRAIADDPRLVEWNKFIYGDDE